MTTIYDDPADILAAKEEGEEVSTSPRYYEEEDERNPRSAPKWSDDSFAPSVVWKF